MIDDQNILTKRQFITGVLDTSPQRDSLLGKQPFEIDRR